MKSQDWIKYVTKEFVQFVDTPKDERLKKKQEKKVSQGSWVEHWFGAVPLAISMLFKRDPKI